MSVSPGRLFLLTAFLTCACHNAASMSDTDAGESAETDAGGDADTDADTDTDDDTDTETNTWPEFPSECHTEAVGDLEVSWCAVPGGEAQMGCDGETEGEWRCQDDELPLHVVTLSPFEMMATEASVALFRACVEDGACDADSFLSYDDSGEDQYGWWQDDCNWDREPVYDYPYGFEDHPMNCVDWEGLRQVCQWLGADLPTEAQWEHVARGEHDGLAGEYWIYAFAPHDSAMWAAGCHYANSPQSYIEPCGMDMTTPVGSLAPTSYGLYDIQGNVGEWLLDWYSPDYYETAETENPTGPVYGDYRLVRGATWFFWEAVLFDAEDHLRSANRAYLPPDLETLQDLEGNGFGDFSLNSIVGIGGRCVRPLPEDQGDIGR